MDERDPEATGEENTRRKRECVCVARGETRGKEEKKSDGKERRRGVVTENVRRIVVRGLGKGALPKVVKMQTTGSSRVLVPKVFLLY